MSRCAPKAGSIKFTALLLTSAKGLETAGRCKKMAIRN